MINHRENRCVDKYFLTRTPFAQEFRPTIDKEDLIRLNSFCAAKETIK